jgi:hypothetical protein
MLLNFFLCSHFSSCPPHAHTHALPLHTHPTYHQHTSRAPRYTLTGACPSLGLRKPL